MLSWKIWLNAILSLTTLVSAYRPVQHCKQLGDNGHYSACTSLTQHYNQTTGEADLYVRYHWYKYKESKNGWHSFALGRKMAGALMFIMYGDPTAPAGDMTVSVRSATGHHPPLLIHDIEEFNSEPAKGRIPEVDIVTQKFQVYNGPFEHPTLHLKPTHVGVAEFVIRRYAVWVGTEVSNTSTAQPLLWSSRYEQDFSDDYAIDRGIEMHAFGMGFGFMFADLLNAETTVPMFGPIDELAGHLGVVEIGEPQPPTQAELSKGEFLVKNANSNANSNPNSNTNSNTNSNAGDKGEDKNKDKDKELADNLDDGEHNPFDDHANIIPVPGSTAASNNNEDTSVDKQTKQTYTIKGKTIRDWMWHLHGLLLSLTFLLLYPLGVYMLRSPAQINAGSSFNHHWTIQALATVTFSIGVFIGYLQSRSISVTHQYIGLFIAFAIAAQMVLGWRHHISFIQFKRKTWLSRIHVGLGRVIIPLGFINILSGMRLRQYGWFTMLLVLVVVIVEVVFGGVYLRASHVRRAKMGGAAVAEEMKAQGPGKDEDEEEYFQLAGDGDEDESEGEDEAAERRREDKRVQSERLARLDRV